MLAHFFTDVILHALIPFTATLQAETGRILATAGVVVAVLLIIVWALRTLITEISLTIATHRIHDGQTIHRGWQCGDGGGEVNMKVTVSSTLTVT